MKKTVLLLLLLASLLLALVPAALAENYPLDPYFAESRGFYRQDDEPGVREKDAAVAISVSTPSNIKTGKSVVFGVTVSGSVTAPCKYYYQVLSDDPHSMEVYGEKSLQSNYKMQGENYTDSPYFSFTFQTPGRYYLQVTVEDATGRQYKRYSGGYPSSAAFQVTGTDLLAQRMDQIAAECRQYAYTDFDRALWLHDWLLNHATYDYDYSRYSAEGVIMHGTGVCDSYRKAYKELLNRVGVQATAATSSSHAWNQVLLEGQWYNIDVTWDDTDSLTSSEGRNLISTHLFFGVPDSLLHRVPSHSPETTKYPCVALDCNYAFRTGLYSVWQDDIVTSINNNIENGQLVMNLTLNNKYHHNGYIWSMQYPWLYYGVSAYQLPMANWAIKGYPATLQLSYDPAGDPLYMFVVIRYTPINPATSNTATLPANLKQIGPYAFYKTPIQLVTVPSGCTSLGRFAFSRCTQLREVHIPASVTSINATCFQNAGDFVLFAPENSYAAQFALDNNIRLQIE